MGLIEVSGLEEGAIEYHAIFVESNESGIVTYIDPFDKKRKTVSSESLKYDYSVTRK